jgi:hypothetical protein
VYSINPPTEADLKENIRNTAFSVSSAELRRGTTCLLCVTRVWVPKETTASTYGE